MAKKGYDDTVTLIGRPALRMLDVPTECMNLPLLDSITRYVEEGVPVGDFLTALLSDELVEAFDRADKDNIARMRDYATLLHWSLPANCWGSRGTVKAWLAAHAELRTHKEANDG